MLELKSQDLHTSVNYVDGQTVVEVRHLPTGRVAVEKSGFLMFASLRDRAEDQLRAQLSKKIPDPKPFSPDLAEHPAVQKHGKGVSSEELASFTECLASMTSSRIRGVGNEQYSRGNGQQFEGMTSEELTEGLLEELADVVGYASMLAIKFLAATKGQQ